MAGLAFAFGLFSCWSFVLLFPLLAGTGPSHQSIIMRAVTGGLTKVSIMVPKTSIICRILPCCLHRFTLCLYRLVIYFGVVLPPGFYPREYGGFCLMSSALTHLNGSFGPRL